MIFSIYLVASIAFLGVPFGFVSALVATALIDLMIIGFLLDRAEEVKENCRIALGKIR